MEERELAQLLQQVVERLTPGPTPVLAILREARALNRRRGRPDGVQSRGSKTNTGRTAPSGPAASRAASSAGLSPSRRSRRNHSSEVGTRGA